MAICEWCGFEMLEERSCTLSRVRLGGTWYQRDRSYYELGVRCHDCGIENAQGNLHHPMCDVEMCPKCGWQLLSCECGLEAFGS